MKVVTNGPTRALARVSVSDADADLEHLVMLTRIPAEGGRRSGTLLRSQVLLQHALLGDGNVVAGGVLDHVHHFVGLADDLVRALRVFRISRNAHASADIQIQLFFFEERGAAKHVQQTESDYHCRIFSRLGKENYELVATVAEGIVDEAQVRLDLKADLVEQFTANEMPVSVVDLLEVVEIDEHHAELVIETMRAIDFGFKRLVQVSRVVEPGAVVSDREFLDLLDRPGVFDRDRSVVAERVEEEHLVVGEAFHGAIDELDHAQHAVLRFERHADDRARLPLGHLVDALGEARIVVDVGHEERLAVFGDPSGDAFSHFEADAFECVGGVADGDGEVELVFLLIDHQERPGVGPKEDGHLLHDGLQNRIEVQRRREGFRDIVEDADLFHLPFAIGSGGLSHCAQSGENPAYRVRRTPPLHFR